jgi:dephospho-CoA kinase
MGSGKSTVATMLAKLGATVIDADAISRATTAANGLAIDALERAFGAGLLTPERALDREKMRTLVFSDPQAKRLLEEIVHPLVGQDILRKAEAFQAAGAHCIVFDIPLLVESQHWRQTLDRILVIDCTPQTQISRVIARSGLDSDGVKKIMASQASRTQRLKAADCVICNDGMAMDALEREVRNIAPLFGL